MGSLRTLLTTPEQAKEIAASVLAKEAKQAPFMHPPTEPALFTWYGHVFSGALQQLRPDGVTLLSKTTHAIDSNLVRALLDAQPTRSEINIDATISDFDGRYHVVQRLSRRRVGKLTAEQAAWAQTHPFLPVEVWAQSEIPLYGPPGDSAKIRYHAGGES